MWLVITLHSWLPPRRTCPCTQSLLPGWNEKHGAMSGLLFDLLPVKTWWLPRELVSLMYPEIFYISITADPIRLGIQSASCFWGQHLGNIFAIILHLLLLADLTILSHTCFTLFISLLNPHTSKIHCAHLIPSVLLLFIWDSHTQALEREIKSPWEAYLTYPFLKWAHLTWKGRG